MEIGLIALALLVIINWRKIFVFFCMLLAMTNAGEIQEAIWEKEAEKNLETCILLAIKKLNDRFKSKHFLKIVQDDILPKIGALAGEHNKEPYFDGEKVNVFEVEKEIKFKIYNYLMVVIMSGKDDSIELQSCANKLKTECKSFGYEV